MRGSEWEDLTTDDDGGHGMHTGRVGLDEIGAVCPSRWQPGQRPSRHGRLTDLLAQACRPARQRPRPATGAPPPAARCPGGSFLGPPSSNARASASSALRVTARWLRQHLIPTPRCFETECRMFKSCRWRSLKPKQAASDQRVCGREAFSLTWLRSTGSRPLEGVHPQCAATMIYGGVCWFAP